MTVLYSQGERSLKKMATETLSRERVLEIIEECGGDKEHLLSILIEIQREC